jgi:WD40 repeat protein
LLVSGSGNPDYSIKIWDPVNYFLVKTIPGNRSTICFLTILKNGYLVSGSRDNTIRVWNTNAD